MVARTLNTVDDVVKVLGGTKAVAGLTGRTDSAISNWRKANTFPANTYLHLKSLLASHSCAAPDSLWGMAKVEEAAS